MKLEDFKITQALISVSNKNKIENVASALQQRKIPILSSDGTAKYLKTHNVSTLEIAEYTNQAELLNGRVKTLHPNIHAGILARTNNEFDQNDLKQFNIKPINLIIINLYPFTEYTKNKENLNSEHFLEYIDIGGQTLIRSAAKNYHHTVIVTDLNDYDWLVNKLANNELINLSERLNLATKAFNYTANYEMAISEVFNKLNYGNDATHNTLLESVLPTELQLSLKQIQSLRYGENPDQKAALYTIEQHNKNNSEPDNFNLLQGKTLSYNNLVDSNAAINIIKSLELLTNNNLTSCAIIKHASPCGVAAIPSIKDDVNYVSHAYKKAYDSDPRSAFGGIIAINKTIDATAADTIINNQFLEVLIAADFTDDAKQIIKNKPNIRLLKYNFNIKHNNFVDNLQFKSIDGKILIQTNMVTENLELNENFCIVTNNKTFSQETLRDLKFSWYIVSHVKSNAIVIADNLQTIGIGTGQTSRIGSIEIALDLTKKHGHDTNNAVLASDAFFPFNDSIKLAHKHGIKAIIQPGGSKNDRDIIACANRLNLLMVFTNKRKFCH